MSYTVSELTAPTILALQSFTGEDEVDGTIVECVVNRLSEAMDIMNESGYWTEEVANLIESTSTYVQTDLDEFGLAVYTACFEDALEAFEMV
jgi:hypothetical protein